MNWSFKIGRVLGIDLKVHVTFLLILLWAGFAAASGGVVGVLFNLTFILLLFVCVTLHELGHAEVAQRHGIPVHEIILLPIGGLAVLGHNPKTPRDELLIAVAGPLVNVVIALGLGLGFALSGRLGNADLMGLVHSGKYTFALLIERLFQANVALALFNLIPAFPMDGGRILRGILGYYVPPTKATRIATGVGQLVAVVIFVYAISYGNLLLAIVAGFVFFAAGAERLESQAGTILSTRRVGDAYNRYAITLSLADRVSNVVEYLLKSYQPDFAVVSGGGQLVGIVTRDDVTKWLAGNLYDVYVTEIMEEPTGVLKVQSALSLDEVRGRMGDSGHRVAAVYEAELFLGLVSAEDIAEAMHILSFLDRAKRGGQYSTARRVADGATPPGTTVQPM